jgi:hypothetical protein
MSAVDTNRPDSTGGHRRLRQCPLTDTGRPDSTRRTPQAAAVSADGHRPSGQHPADTRRLRQCPRADTSRPGMRLPGGGRQNAEQSVLSSSKPASFSGASGTTTAAPCAPLAQAATA